MERLKIIETKDYLFQINEEKKVIPVGKYAVHLFAGYTPNCPNGEHFIMKCTKENQTHIEEHWREILFHLPKLGTKSIEGIPLLNYETKLIKAAPEMLEALQSIAGIEAWINDSAMKELFQKKVYDAIKKATE